MPDSIPILTNSRRRRFEIIFVALNHLQFLGLDRVFVSNGTARSAPTESKVTPNTTRLTHRSSHASLRFHLLLQIQNVNDG